MGVKYEDLYEYLICLDISPCPGYMNKDEKVRNQTAERAEVLSNIYSELLHSGLKFNNFDWDYFPFPTHSLFKNWTK